MPALQEHQLLLLPQLHPQALSWGLARTSPAGELFGSPGWPRSLQPHFRAKCWKDTQVSQRPSLALWGTGAGPTKAPHSGTLPGPVHAFPAQQRPGSTSLSEVTPRTGALLKGELAFQSPFSSRRGRAVMVRAVPCHRPPEPPGPHWESSESCE